MQTAYSTACYFARQAANLCRYNGIHVKGFSRLDSPINGAIWKFDCEKTGLAIALNSNGTVNQTATKGLKA